MAKIIEQRPLNPLSDFFKKADGKRLLEADARVARIGAFFDDMHDDKVIVQAVAENGRRVQLGKLGARVEDVDRIDGIWYIQTKFPHRIMHINEKDMVLIKKYNQEEKSPFEFWTAKPVNYNHYGPFIEQNAEYFLVAKYETNNRVIWGYGKTQQEVYKYLETKLYNEYKEIVHHIARYNQSNVKC